MLFTKIMRSLFITTIALLMLSCTTISTEVADSYVVAVSRAVNEDKPWADVRGFDTANLQTKRV